MNTEQTLAVRDELAKKPAVEARNKKGYKKLALASGLSIVISPRLQSNLRSRNMIVALNGKLFPAHGKTQALVDEARTEWVRINTTDTANMLRFDLGA